MILALALAVYLLASFRSLSSSDQLDLYVYRMGAMLALSGQTPYDTPRFQAEVAQQFPPREENAFADNCGFFLPPQAIAMFAPFALLEWDVTQVVWWLFLTACAFSTASLAWTFGRDRSRRGIGWQFIVAAVLLNPITMPSLVVGQTTLLAVAGIAIGQLFFERGRPTPGCILWSLTFVKPHLALLFLVFAVVQGGWKRGTVIVVLVGLWNLLGGLLLRHNVQGAIRLLPEYLDYLGTAHKAVVFNLVQFNDQITSWNRVLFALGGPTINLRIAHILAGYALWIALIACRSRRRLLQNPAYLLAAAAVGTLFFAQVIAYEALLLILLAPLVLQHLDAGRKNDVYFLLGLLLFLVIPMDAMKRIADIWQMGEESRGRILLKSHKCFGTMVIALYLLIRGPTVREIAPESAFGATPQAARKQ